MTDHRILYPQPLFPPSGVQTPRTVGKPGNAQCGTQTTSFDQVLQQQLGGVKFSQHALQRLKHRNIELSPSDMAKLNQAVDKAEQKGAQESLVIMNQLALVVSIKNKTVITAVDGASMKDSVFTNIDSAVLV